MSLGITLKDLVQQVWYMQEKVILDIYPTDDKFKEVIMETNFVIQELQKEEDWSWLREERLLGYTEPDYNEFELEDDVYKVCTLYGDKARLIASQEQYQLGPHVIYAPYVSGGMATHRQLSQTDRVLNTNMPNHELGLILKENKLVFNRHLLPHEMHRAIYADVQLRMETIDMAEIEQDYIDGGTLWLEKLYFREVPDPLYIVTKVAALHAEGSPLAQGRLAGLNDAAQKLLSAMRQNDAATTAPDYIDYGSIDTVMIV